jgi:glyoxylase-like metal-dependent hydrolase (beta-lactamase superfamily II)
MEIARGVRRLGGPGSGTVNCYLIEDASGLTIIDAGMPRQWSDLQRELADMRRTLDDIRAVVLTHGHTDHIGFAERVRRSSGTPVLVHEFDAALARGETPNPARGFGPVRAIPLLRFLLLGVRLGFMRTPAVGEVGVYGDGATLDVPGSPTVIAVPGHTPGSAALHVPSLGAIFVGDALATYSVTTGRRGPQLAPFTADPDQAARSLDRLRGNDAAIVLPGHGEPWTRGIEEAIKRVGGAN